MTKKRIYVEIIDLEHELENLDGSDVDRVVNELIGRGGPHAILGRFLREKLSECYAAVDPECCVGDD